MERKTFIKLSSALAATPFIPGLEAWDQQKRLSNWAGNFRFSTDQVYYPGSVEDVQRIVKKCSRLRPLGTRHCFNRIADSKDNLVSSRDLNKVVALDTDASTVTVEAGIKYGELCPYLQEKGYALHNLASLPHISVAGSCATATHGSGVKNGNLASAITGIEMVIADGSIVSLSRDKDGDNFAATVVGLGAGGMITKVTLKVEPAYKMRQNVFLDLPLSQLKSNFEEIVSAGYSVSLFTDWQPESINEVWVKSRIQNETNYQQVPVFFGAKAATKDLHPIVTLSAENCTEQMGVEADWYQRLPHFKMGFTPSSGKELQAEYYVPINHAMDAVMAVQKLGKQIGPHLFISEIRTIAADDLWMSPCYKQASATIHFTWKQDWPNASKLLPVIEKALEPFKPRPHWGKPFAMSPRTLAARYDRMEDFKKLVSKYDPGRKFTNEFLAKTIYTSV